MSKVNEFHKNISIAGPYHSITVFTVQSPMSTSAGGGGWKVAARMVWAGMRL